MRKWFPHFFGRSSSRLLSRFFPRRNTSKFFRIDRWSDLFPSHTQGLTCSTHRLINHRSFTTWKPLSRPPMNSVLDEYRSEATLSGDHVNNDQMCGDRLGSDWLFVTRRPAEQMWPRIWSSTKIDSSRSTRIMPDPHCFCNCSCFEALHLLPLVHLSRTKLITISDSNLQLFRTFSFKLDQNVRFRSVHMLEVRTCSCIYSNDHRTPMVSSWNPVTVYYPVDMIPSYDR